MNEKKEIDVDEGSLETPSSDLIHITTSNLYRKTYFLKSNEGVKSVR